MCTARPALQSAPRAQRAAKCVLEHILSHTGELQEELNRMYDEAFTDFMTDFVAQVGALFFV